MQTSENHIVKNFERVDSTDNFTLVVHTTIFLPCDFRRRTQSTDNW